MSRKWTTAQKKAMSENAKARHRKRKLESAQKQQKEPTKEVLAPKDPWEGLNIKPSRLVMVEDSYRGKYNELAEKYADLAIKYVALSDKANGRV